MGKATHHRQVAELLDMCVRLIDIAAFEQPSMFPACGLPRQPLTRDEQD
jgi:hypothetical protein